MAFIPEHWRNYYEKLIDRGWIDPDTLKTIPSHKEKISQISLLPIDDESLIKLRDLLLDLGIKDDNIIITELYFELGRRSKNISFYHNEEAETLFNRGILKSNATKDDWNNINKPLPIDEDKYIDIALLLGRLAIDDKEKDEIYGMIIPSSFLYLQNRARNGNGYKLNNDIDKIENTISVMLEEKGLGRKI